MELSGSESRDSVRKRVERHIREDFSLEKVAALFRVVSTSYREVFEEEKANDLLQAFIDPTLIQKRQLRIESRLGQIRRIDGLSITMGRCDSNGYPYHLIRSGRFSGTVSYTRSPDDFVRPSGHRTGIADRHQRTLWNEQDSDDAHHYPFVLTHGPLLTQGTLDQGRLGWMRLIIPDRGCTGHAVEPFDLLDMFGLSVSTEESRTEPANIPDHAAAPLREIRKAQ